MKLSEFLKSQATKLYSESTEHVAVEMLKSAGMTEVDARTEVAQKLMEKEAAASLVAQGIDYDTALSLVKTAGIKIKDMASFKPEPTFEEMMAASFEKAAALAEELEAKAEHAEVLFEKVAELESILDATPETVQVPAGISKLAESGQFTNEDLDALMKLPSDTLTKVASQQEQPWKMGKAAGVAENTLDPLAAFLLS